MGQSLAQVYLHIVFSTKLRKPFLTDQNLRCELHAYLAGACHNLDSPSMQIGGVEDHVHILRQLSKTSSVADLVRELKRESSKWLKPKIAEFQWQQGYGALSASPSHVDALKNYIRNRQEHHRTETFQDEVRRLFRKYGVEFDERYVWE